MRTIPLLIAATLLSASALAADYEIHNEGDKIIITPAPDTMTKDQEAILQHRLAGSGINYMWITVGGREVRIGLLGDTDPRDVCDLASNYPKVNVTSVVNYTTTITARCR